MEYKVGEVVFDGWKIVREISNSTDNQMWEIVKKDHNVSIYSVLQIIRIPGDSSLKQTLYEDGMDEESVMEFFQDIVDELIAEIEFITEEENFPYVVKYEDYKVISYPGEIKWDILIRMECLTSLRAFTKEKTISEENTLEMSKKLVQILKLFENNKIIYGNITPDNIFVDNDGDFKIGNSRVTKILDKIFTDSSESKKENYIAPEVLQGKKCDYSADIYSVGMILYKLLNEDKLPFCSANTSGQELPQPCAASEKFGKIILIMCAYDPKDRYQNAGDLLADLEQITEINKSDKQEQKEVGTAPMIEEAQLIEATRKKGIKKRVFAAPLLVLFAGLIVHFVVVPNIYGQMVSFIDWLISDPQNIVETLRTPDEILKNIYYINAIKIFWYIWLAVLVASLFFVGRELQKKPEPDMKNTILIKKEAYILAQNIMESLKKESLNNKSKELQEFITSFKRLEERLSVESDFGIGNALVINCENNIARQLQYILDSAPYISSGDMIRNITELNKAVININLLLRNRTELKKK